MTNKDKYLKEGVSVEELAKDITKFIAEGYPDSFIFPKSIEDYFKAETKPTLTEDERVILRNIDKENATHIKRDNGLKFIDKNEYVKEYYELPFNSLFQFIKERRRIRNS